MNTPVDYWIYIPFLLAFFQGLITAASVFKSGQNKHLALLIVLLSLGALMDTGILKEESQLIQILWNGNEFLFGPLIFLAINCQLAAPVKNRAIHFYAFILMKLMVITIVSQPLVASSIPEWLGLFFSLLLCLHGLSYTIYCMYLLYKVDSKKHDKEVKWLQLLVWMFLCAWLVALISKIIKPFDVIWAASLFYMVYCTVLIIIYYLSFIITDRIFPSSRNKVKDSANEFEIITSVNGSEIVSKDKTASVQKYSKSSLTKEQIAEYAATIKAYFEKEKPYLDFEFSFSRLSQVLNISTHQLSQTFNESFGKTYPQVIKELRIQEAVKRLQDEKYAHLSIYGIALDCGFNSKSMFNQAFKEITGFTPTGFKKAKKFL